MAQQTLTTSNDIFIRGSIDPLKAELVKINENFTELYIRLPAPPTSGTQVLTSTDGVVTWEDAA
jgi:hypothetical protein